MNYIQSIAEQIRVKVPEGVMPHASDLDLLFNMYALLLLAKGEKVTDEDVHNAWAVWMSVSTPDHDSIHPFSELSKDIKQQDRPFTAAIRQTYSELGKEV